MTKRLEIYKCEVCGNIVEMLHTGDGELVCCGQPMDYQDPKTEDQGNEKHVPVIEKTGDGYLVKVGEVEHPMEKEHYIEWIELVTDTGVLREYLSPGDSPQAEFMTAAGKVYAREGCTVHGVWKSR